MEQQPQHFPMHQFTSAPAPPPPGRHRRGLLFLPLFLVLATTVAAEPVASIEEQRSDASGWKRSRPLAPEDAPRWTTHLDHQSGNDRARLAGARNRKLQGFGEGEEGAEMEVSQSTVSSE